MAANADPSERAVANDVMIRDFLAAWERRDTAHIVERLTDHCVYHSIPLTPIVGKAAVSGKAYEAG